MHHHHTVQPYQLGPFEIRPNLMRHPPYVTYCVFANGRDTGARFLSPPLDVDSARYEIANREQRLQSIKRFGGRGGSTEGRVLRSDAAIDYTLGGRIKQHLAKHPGASASEMADALAIASQSKMEEALKKLRKDGEIQSARRGQSNFGYRLRVRA
jgi:hypothetical protein